MVTKKICPFCKEAYGVFGNNSLSLHEDRCCDKCNKNIVLPEREKDTEDSLAVHNASLEGENDK